MAHHLLASKLRLRLSAVCFLSVVGTASVWAQAAAPAAPPPPEDEIVFSNGDKLTGKLTRVVGGSVLFHSDIAGDVTVSIDKVKELHTQGNYAVLLHGVPVKQSQQAKPGKIEVAETNVTVTPPAGQAETSSSKDVAYVIDEATFKKELQHDPGLFHGWNGSATLGTSYSQSTIHGGTVTAGVSLVRQLPVLTFFPARRKTTIDFSENYGVLTTPGFIASPGVAGAVDVQAKTSIMHADAEQDEYLSKRLFALGSVAFDHNYALSLDLQQIYGGGLGWTAVKDALQELDLKGEVQYEKQQFFGGIGNQNLIGSTFSDSYHRNLPGKLVFTQTASYLPAWNNTHAYSAYGTVGLTAPLFKKFALNLSATDNFINNPVPGYQKNSVTFTTGLTYLFK